jgi:acid phosphatase
MPLIPYNGPSVCEAGNQSFGQPCEAPMRKLAVLLVLLLLSAATVLLQVGGTASAEKAACVIPWPPGLPIYDHVIIVIEENKDYDQIIDRPEAPYLNTLRKDGANFTRMFGEEHFSQGNYFWLFSGSNQNVGFRDMIPTTKNNPNYPFHAPNLGASLIARRLSFKGYAEDLPAIGSTVESVPPDAKTIVYGRKHVPWISFANVPNGNTVETSSNLRFADFPTDPAKFNTLPTVAIVIPNLENDMHNGKPPDSITRGDAWLKKNIDAYYQWARKNNSLLIVTFDECDDKRDYVGLTNPFVEAKNEYRKDIQNRIPTLFVGDHIKPGDYPEGKGITHVNLLRTLEAMYGLPKAGAQQPNAAGGGISDDTIITDVFEKVK